MQVLAKKQTARQQRPALRGTQPTMNGAATPHPLLMRHSMPSSGVQSRFDHPVAGSNFSKIPVRPSLPGRLQTKLAVNTPGDVYEQEADRVAEQVMRMTEPQLQRKCACGGSCPDCSKEKDEDLPRLQMKSVSGSSAGHAEAPPSVHEVLRSPGQPLDATTRAFMEPRFGRDFSAVRVHTDAAAAQSAEDVHALAYTMGRNVVFAPGQFAPGTAGGRTLLAHELTHTVQQGHSGLFQSIQRQTANETNDLFPAHHKFISGMGPGDRIAGRNLFNWARARGYAEIVTETTLRRMQEYPDSEDAVINDIYLLLIEQVSGRDPQTGREVPSDFEGPEAARGAPLLELEEHFEEQVGRFLRIQLALFLEREFQGAMERKPADAYLTTDPQVIREIRANKLQGSAVTGRWSDIAKPGERRGNLHVVGIFNPRADGVPNIWFFLRNHPSWYYEMSGVAFIKTDPTVSEVAASVAESTKLAGELFPLMIKVGAFGVGMSAGLAAVIASVALDELGEEGLREARGEEHRSAWEILKSATVGIVVGGIMDRVFGGGKAAEKSGGEAGLASKTAADEAKKGSDVAAAFEDRAATAVRKDVAHLEAPQVSAELRAGRAHPVEQPIDGERYVAEVKIASDGQIHTYRLNEQGRWCRFTQRLCFLPGEAPESEWNEIYEAADREASESLGKIGRESRRTFIAGRVRYEITAGEGAFARLEAAAAGAQVYVIRDSSGKVMYVGIIGQQTAGRTALKRLQEHLREKAGDFIGDASSIEIKGVGLEEREARALEDDLISHHNPKWNRRERDPQSYSRKYRAEPTPEEVERANNISLKFNIGLTNRR